MDGIAMCQNQNNAKRQFRKKRRALVRYNEHDDTITKRTWHLLKKERRKQFEIS